MSFTRLIRFSIISFSLALGASFARAVDGVQILSPLPLPVAVKNSTNSPVNVTCLSGCSGGGSGGSVYVSSGNVNAVISSTYPVQVSLPNGTTVYGTISINNWPAMWQSTQPVIMVGTPTVNSQQIGTRWNVAFSTTTTTAVLPVVSTTTSLAVSTPIAGSGSMTVRVFRLIVTVDAATTLTFYDGSTPFGEQYPMTANGAIVLDLTNEPWYITSAGNGFVVRQTGSANIGERIWYTKS